MTVVSVSVCSHDTLMLRNCTAVFVWLAVEKSLEILF